MGISQGILKHFSFKGDDQFSYDYSLITKSRFSFGNVDADSLSNQGAITKSKISFGDGDGDYVYALGSISNNKISFGDGDGDYVYAQGSISSTYPFKWKKL